MRQLFERAAENLTQRALHEGERQAPVGDRRPEREPTIDPIGERFGKKRLSDLLQPIH
jgi:hypothetical protein